MPEVVVTHVGYIVALVEVSSVTAVFVAFVAVVAVEAVFAVIDVLHENPVPDVHRRALDAVLHDGTLCPVGATAVKDPRRWFADSAVVRVPAVVADVAFPARAPVNVVVVRLFVDGLNVSPDPMLAA